MFFFFSFGLLYLQDLLIQLQAVALDEAVGCCGHLVCQVPQSTKGKLQSGVHHSNHGFLLHDSQQLLLDRAKEKRKHETRKEYICKNTGNNLSQVSEACSVEYNMHLLDEKITYLHGSRNNK